MKELDCETRKSAQESIVSIFQINSDELRSFFDQVDFEEFFERHRYYNGNGADAIYEMFGRTPKVSQYYVNWFHLTRVVGQFRRDLGILNLQESLEIVWSDLYGLVSDRISQATWNEYKGHMQVSRHHLAGLYRSKTKKEGGDGPFAVLNPLVGLHAGDISYHDYLGIPEIVEDICQTLDEKYGIGLETLYRDNSRPCIVKFKKLERGDVGLRECLYYLCESYKNEPFSHVANTNFCGYGAKVLPEEIVKVYYPRI